MDKLQRTVLAPEEVELRKKRSVLERLKDRLADREEEMADLRSELERFEAQYTMEVGWLYADFVVVEAQIAEEEAILVPEDQEIAPDERYMDFVRYAGVSARRQGVQGLHVHAREHNQAVAYHWGNRGNRALDFLLLAMTAIISGRSCDM